MLDWQDDTMEKYKDIRIKVYKTIKNPDIIRFNIARPIIDSLFKLDNIGKGDNIKHRVVNWVRRYDAIVSPDDLKDWLHEKSLKVTEVYDDTYKRNILLIDSDDKALLNLMYERLSNLADYIVLPKESQGNDRVNLYISKLNELSRVYQPDLDMYKEKIRMKYLYVSELDSLSLINFDNKLLRLESNKKHYNEYLAFSYEEAKRILRTRLRPGYATHRLIKKNKAKGYDSAEAEMAVPKFMESLERLCMYFKEDEGIILKIYPTNWDYSY